MKKIRASILFCLITVSSFSQFDSSIVGKWKFKDVPDKSRMDSTGLKMLTAYFGNFTIYLRPDGKYIHTLMKQEEGAWTFTGTTKTLTLTANKGTVSKYQVSPAANQTLLFSLGQGKDLLLEKTVPTPEDEREINITPTVTTPITKEQLCKTWYFQNREKPGTSAEALDITNELFRGSTFFDFKADKGYHVTIGKIEENGVWSLENNNTTLVLVADSTKWFWQVKKVTANELVLTKGNTDETWTFSSKK